MAKHELSLDAHDGNSLKVLRLFDTSHYCDSDPIDNYLIEVLPVNRSVWITFFVQKGFSVALNSSNLRYKKVGSESELIDLPDGIYEFKQSYKPNIHTLVHYYYLRVTALTFKYLELLCSHFQNECKKEASVYNKETLFLTKIKQYIDAAKYMVNEKGDKECGLGFYNEAVSLINQYENECGCR